VSPDGRSVAFSVHVKALDRSSSSRRSRLVILDVATGELAFYDEPSGIGPEMWYGASWSPDSRKLAFTFVEGFPNNPQDISFSTWILDLESRNMRRALRLNQGILQYPRFSPQGNRLLVRDASTGNVAVFDSSSGSHAFLIPTPENDGGPTGPGSIGVYRLGYCWSSDGQSAYISRGYMNSSDPGIWNIDIQSGRRTLLSDSHRSWAVCSAPNGKHLAFFDQGADVTEPFKLRVMSLPDLDVTTVSQQAREYSLCWSGSGGRLAFCEEGKLMMWSSSLDESVVVWSGDDQPSYPSWVGSTDSLVFLRNGRQLWLLNAGTRETRLLAEATAVLESQPSVQKLPSNHRVQTESETPIR
jgi:Tol biopolymer transport system component